MGKKRKKPAKGSFLARNFIVPVVCLLGVISASGFYIFNTVYTYFEALNAPIVMELDPNIGVRSYVTEFFTNNGAEEMLPIIACESNFKHFGKDRQVLRNQQGSSAIGVAQIMSSVHPDPKILNRYNKSNNTDLTVEDFDVRTLEGNVGYALVLYSVRGVRDWECAGKSVALGG
tara:strand:+ start:829 stop:1350 length:522 start_codon:yes stop_codon:yes gene_type:complete